MEESSTGRQPDDRQSWFQHPDTGPLVSIALGWLLILGARFLVPAVLPQVKASFQFDNASAGFAVTLIWMGYALMQFPAGILVDWVGERVLLAGSLGLAGGSLVAMGTAPSPLVFLVACGLLGLSTGLYGPARGTALSKIFAEGSGLAFGITLAAGSLGSAALPYLSSQLIADHSWRALLTGLLGPFLAVAILAWWQVPALRGTTDGPNLSIKDTAGSVGEALTDPTLVRIVAAMTLMLFIFQGLTAFMPTYLIEEKGFSQATAVGLFALLFISGAVFQISAGRAADLVGVRRVLLFVGTLGILPLVAFPFVEGVVLLAALIFVLGSRLAASPVTNDFVVGTLPDQVTGVSWGLLRTLLFILGSTGSWFIGTLADAGYFDIAFFVLGALSAGAAILYFSLPAETGA